ARLLRYAFFRRAAETLRLACVAVAHTADDQAETVLARLVRGTGPSGLTAIYPRNGIVVRPLLEFRRAELRRCLEEMGQDWREDLSNRDVVRLRARIRHELLPLLETRLQPAIVSHLGQLAQFSRQDEAFWKLVVADRLRAVQQLQGPRVGIR